MLSATLSMDGTSVDHRVEMVPEPVGVERIAGLVAARQSIQVSGRVGAGCQLWQSLRDQLGCGVYQLRACSPLGGQSVR